MSPVRIVVVDDHTIVRDGLKRLLEHQPAVTIVGEADNGTAAVETVKRTAPDVVLMDLSMPGLSGTDATRTLRAACPASRVLALTVHEGEGYVREFLKAGAHGYLLKRATTDELLRAIHVVASGGTYVDPRVSRTLVETLVSPRAAQQLVDLSERETEVLRLIALGHPNKEIAANLELSVKSVETYKARAMEKLGLRDRVDIVRLALDRGWFG
jgi:DNA-binding NarL/FixJ family response regulator